MFLLILESLGTPELILIAVVALIVFGPRKLPQMAKTMAKTIAEFKNATSEFKSTWEKEIAFEEDVKTEKREVSIIDNQVTIENSISRTTTLELTNENIFAPPKVKELSEEEIAQTFQNQSKTEKAILPKENSEKTASEKRDWL